MVPPTRSRRFAAQLALAAGPVLAGLSMVTQPQLTGSPADQLAAIAGSKTAAFSAVVFVVSQLAFLVAVLAIGRLLLPRAPRLSAWGTALGVLGAFGHSVFGGVSLTWIVMAHDAAHPDADAALFHQLQGSPVMAFSLLGLVGTVLGLVVLGVGLFRSGTGPRWVGPALWAFVLVEFVGGAISSWASYLSSALLLAAFLPLAALTARRVDDVAASAAPAIAGG
ncbi:MAG: hypothetical protein ACTHN8_12900 [Angustibacter sp.]